MQYTCDNIFERHYLEKLRKKRASLKRRKEENMKTIIEKLDKIEEHIKIQTKQLKEIAMELRKYGKD